MKQVLLKEGTTPVSPRTTEDSLYPNIDSSYSLVPYTGPRLNIRMSQVFGFKRFSGTNSGTQGMAIYGNILVRMCNVSTSTTHYIYTISSAGITQIATFVLSTTGHSNALQFAPFIESGNAFPYLYVSDTNGKCYVLNIAADYTVTLAQTITISGVSQVLMGDDGYVWANLTTTDERKKFIKYRHVNVSEGNITLTDADKLTEWETYETYPTSIYTSQGWKAKHGKIYYIFAWEGAGYKRVVAIYDSATGGLLNTLDLSDYINYEFEDLDFWDNAMIIACNDGPCFLLRF